MEYMLRKMKLLIFLGIVLTCNQIKVNGSWRRLQVHDWFRSLESYELQGYRAKKYPCNSYMYLVSVSKCLPTCFKESALGLHFCDNQECCDVCRGELDMEMYCGSPNGPPVPPILAPPCGPESCYTECIRTNCNHKTCCDSCQNGIQKSCYKNVLLHPPPSALYPSNLLPTLFPQYGQYPPPPPQLPLPILPIKWKGSIA